MCREWSVFFIMLNIFFGFNEISSKLMENDFVDEFFDYVFFFCGYKIYFII